MPIYMASHEPSAKVSFKTFEQIARPTRMNNAGSEDAPASQAMANNLPRLPEQATGGLLNRTDQAAPPPAAAADSAASATGNDSGSLTGVPPGVASTTGGANSASAAAAGGGESTVDANAATQGGQANADSGAAANESMNDVQARNANVMKEVEGSQPSAAEYSSESSQFTRMQGLQQAATSMLGSSSQGAQDVLSMMRRS